MRGSSEEDAPARYVVIEADEAEAQRSAAYLRLSGLLGPDYAHQWHDGLLDALAHLPDFPGPLRHAIDERATAEYGREVRRALYYGPKKRRTSMAYKILFTIFPPAAPGDETVLRVLRIVHAATGQGSEGDTAN